uniref:Uncharacterized protein n=1 Tax=Oryza punctata TaxID=4537 RepID=A0A0E0LGD5_ORYPU
MSCLGRAAVPVKRVWLGLTARLGLRRTTGLGKLRNEVRTCEYSDVHVMWEMLSSMDATAPPRHAAAVRAHAVRAHAAAPRRRRRQEDHEGVEPPRLLLLLRLLRKVVHPIRRHQTSDKSKKKLHFGI